MTVDSSPERGGCGWVVKSGVPGCWFWFMASTVARNPMSRLSGKNELAEDPPIRRRSLPATAVAADSPAARVPTVRLRATRCGRHRHTPGPRFHWLYDPQPPEQRGLGQGARAGGGDRRTAMTAAR